MSSTRTLVTLLRPWIRRFTIIISAWWLRTSSKFTWEEVKTSTGKLRKWSTPKRVRIRPKYSASSLSRDRRIKMHQSINHQSSKHNTVSVISDLVQILFDKDKLVVEWIKRLLPKRYAWVWFPVGSNQRLEKLVFTASVLGVQQFRGQCEASAVCGRQVGRWQLDSKTERSLRCLLAKASWWMKFNTIAIVIF